MALQALWSPEQQFQNTNGSILTNGKIYIQYRGRTALAEVFGDASGEHRRANPVILDANGRALCFADDSFSYTAVVCDFYGKELFSFDPIPCGSGSGSSQVTGAPSAHWLGRFGDTRVVSAGQYSDSLPLPANPDYDGSFIESIQGNSNITLATGLYIIDAIVRFRQSPDDLQNLFGQVQVFTGWRDDETTWELRNETGPDSSQEDMHQFRVHLVRHVTGNGDKNFCIQVKTPVNWSWCQIQSLSILSLSSSSGGYGQYIPGDYIQIESDGTINVVGLQPSGNYADAESVAEAFYGVAQDMSALSGQINEVSGQIPSLDGYATQNWVNDQGFLKEVPSQYVTVSELNSAVSGKADKSEIPSLEGYATEDWVRQQNYLTEVPSQYVTESELNSAISGKADKSEIPSLDGYATESYVQSAVSGKQDELEFTYDSDEKITSIDGHEIAGTGGSTYSAGQYVSIQNDIISVTGVQPSGEYLTSQDLNGYATEQWVGEQNFATVDDVDEATSGKLDASAYVAPMNADWSATSGLGQILNKPSTEEVQFEELDLSSYVQQSELSGYASKNDLSGKLDSSAYVAPVNADWSATSGLSQILNKPTTEEVQFEELDLSSYATHSEVVSATSGLQEQLTFSYNESNEISAINNSAIAGGGPIYSGGQYISIDNDVISVTGLQPQENADWNSTSGISEILNKPSTEEVQFEELNLSGYATQSDLLSATSGKQDSLEFGYTSGGSVSAINNSGIYDAPLNEFVNQNSGAWGGEALPVSGGPGIKFRMDNGILIAENDETVLWETSGYGTTSGTFSESYKNFDTLKIFTINNDLQTDTIEINTAKQGESFSVHTFYCNGSDTQWCKDSTFTLSNSGFSLRGAVSYQLGTNGIAGVSFSSNNPINSVLKVIGINRIPGGN